jgi:hypothetical protein
MDFISIDFINNCFLILFILTIFINVKDKVNDLSKIFLIYFFLFVSSTIFYKFFNINFVNTSTGIGKAAFNGLSNHKNYIYIALLILEIFLLKKFLPVKKFISFDDNINSNSKIINNKKIIYFVYLSIVLLITIFYFPNFEVIRPKDSSMDTYGFFLDNWDSSNAVAWSYAIKDGLVPFVDFWYPYYLNYTFNLNIPYGPVIQFTFLLFVFMSFFFISLKISNNILFAFLITIAIILGHKNYLSDVERYLLSINLVGSYLLYSCCKKNTIFIFFSLLLIVALLFEPIQIIYSLPSLLFISIIYNYKKFKLSNIKKELILIIFFLLTILFFLFISHIDLTSFFGWFLRLNDVSNYMSLPFNLKFNGSNINYVYTPFIFLFLLDLKEIVNKKDKICIFMYSLIFIALIMMFKHSARPIFSQMFIPSFILICYFSLLLKSNSFYRYWIVIFVIILMSLSSPFKYKDIFNNFYSLPNKLSVFKELLLNNTYKNYLIQKDRDIERLSKIPDLDYLAKKINYYKIEDFYLFNGDPLIYTYLRKKIPYQINNFSLAPIYEQKKQLENIKKKNFIIINNNNFLLDGFNILVRIPIISNYIVENFSFIEKSKNYSFLIRKKPKENDLFYWSLIIGDTLHYGHLFQNTKIINKDQCKSSCEEYWKVKSIYKNQQSNEKKINIEINNLTFSIIFNLDNNNEAFIKINNIWFLRLAKALNINYRIISSDELNIDILKVDIKDTLY